MPETRLLTNHDEIRAWAAARNGVPAMRPALPSIGNTRAVLCILFGQSSYQEKDEGADRPPGAGGLEILDWDEWFRIFEEKDLALVVHQDAPGQVEDFHELVSR